MDFNQAKQSFYDGQVVGSGTNPLTVRFIKDKQVVCLVANKSDGSGVIVYPSSYIATEFPNGLAGLSSVYYTWFADNADLIGLGLITVAGGSGANVSLADYQETTNEQFSMIFGTAKGSYLSSLGAGAKSTVFGTTVREVPAKKENVFLTGFKAAIGLV